ncbi:hypothetical protein F5B17DRAFT_388068 [Nemania serpens]|nr:hypothetical protein F5B17DRAFT_388068 [Nemania serpens]
MPCSKGVKPCLGEARAMTTRSPTSCECRIVVCVHGRASGSGRSRFFSIAPAIVLGTVRSWFPSHLSTVPSRSAFFPLLCIPDCILTGWLAAWSLGRLVRFWKSEQPTHLRASCVVPPVTASSSGGGGITRLALVIEPELTISDMPSPMPCYLYYAPAL